MIRPTDGTLLVTHRGCLDGTGSALMFLWAGGRRDRILFKSPSSLLLTVDEIPSDVCEVWYADCCPSSMIDPAAGRPFRVFDHHVSNDRLFSHDARCVFDMKKSGTSLLYSQLGIEDDYSSLPGGESVDLLVKALESYDLGRFDYAPGQRLADIAATFNQESFLDLMFTLGPHAILYDSALSARAEAMEGVRKIYSESAERNALYSVVKFSEAPIRVGVASSPVDWKNDVADKILNSGKADMAVIIDITGGMISLRSRESGPDCSLIAGLYGGGGHARAAGFKMGKSQKILEVISNEVFG